MPAASIGLLASMVASLLQLGFAMSGEEFEFPTDAAMHSACVVAATGFAGECRPLSECPSAVEERRRGGHPELCGFPSGSAGLPDVCCPLESARTQQSAESTDAPPEQLSCAAFNLNQSVNLEDVGKGPGSVARRMCLEYQRQICNGVTHRKTFIGFGAFFRAADQMEYPHMALLGYGERDAIEYKCGGSLISPNFVLTAAHCIASGASSVRWVLLGALNRTVSLADKETRQLLEVAEVIVHPEYTVRVRYHDIALLRLAANARVEVDDVRPACLHTDLDGDTDVLLGELGVVTGWGAEAFGDDGSERLLKGIVTVRELTECRGLDTKLPRGLDPRTHMCAGGDGVNPTDACQGDSGGPLQFPTLKNDPDCMFRVAGIVSFGPPCGIGLPGVYTKVAPYVPWIEKIVWAEGQDGQEQGECLPDTGPGSVARRACERYLRSFCSRKLTVRAAVPGTRKDEQCHFQEPPVGVPRQDRHDGVDGVPPLAVEVPADSRAGRRFEDAADNEFPHQVLLTYGAYGRSPNNREVACAGVLVAPNFVLTAAHCATLGCGGQVQQVLVGKEDRTTFPFLSLDVTAVVVHPQYDPSTRYNDVALLRLSEPVPLDVQGRPACLQTEDVDDVVGSLLTASGMTATGRWEDVRGEMRKATVSVEEAAACRQRLQPGQDVRLPRGVADNQLCTEPGGAPVPGETGGPIQVVHRVLNGLEVHRLVGILSVLSPCGSDQPDVYTKVADVVPWIESVVWPAG